MATLTISITTGAGTTTGSKTFSAADSQRILADYKVYSRNDAASQQDITEFLLADALAVLRKVVRQVETVEPTPPAFT